MEVKSVSRYKKLPMHHRYTNPNSLAQKHTPRNSFTRHTLYHYHIPLPLPKCPSLRNSVPTPMPRRIRIIERTNSDNEIHHDAKHTFKIIALAIS